MSEFRFAEAYPASGTYGPAMAVTDRASGRLFGYTRRIEGHQFWMVYGPDGDELGTSNQRIAAARWLRDRTTTPPPPNVPVAADVAGDEAGEV